MGQIRCHVATLPRRASSESGVIGVFKGPSLSFITSIPRAPYAQIAAIAAWSEDGAAFRMHFARNVEALEYGKSMGHNHAGDAFQTI